MSGLNPSRIEFDHRAWLAQRRAIVDPVGVEATLWSGLPSTVLCPSRFPVEDSVLPRLVRLDELDMDVRIDVMERGHAWLKDSGKPLFGALLDVTADDESVDAHLKSRMRVTRPGHGRFWLRFHDHRVFGHLVRILTPPQLACLLGPARTWTWFDPNEGAWLQIAKPKVESTPLRSLDAPQWEQLQRIELLNVVASSLRRRLGNQGLGVESMTRLDGVLAGVLGSAGHTSRRDICRRAEQQFLQCSQSEPIAHSATV